MENGNKDNFNHGPIKLPGKRPYKKKNNKAMSVFELEINGSADEKMREQVEEEDNDDEDLGVAETYSNYMPSKLKVGKRHPDPVVETASLSSVQPPDIDYNLSLPETIIESGSLSALQLEAISYAAQQHEHFLPDGTRAGFLIGDGAGVGKGRTIAGCIYENFLNGRKRAIWVSVSNDLKYDSERDLKDIGASEIKVYPLNKFKYSKISSAVNGWLSEGVIFSTYAALIGETSMAVGSCKTRLNQLLDWCGDDFDGVIVFDECHRAKNLHPVGSSKPTKTGKTVLKLQNLLPKARVVYASATGASEPRNMAYMTRLGMWGPGTPFPEFSHFIASVEKRGVGAMEIVAMDMKLRGMYIARQLSFHGVTFNIEEVPLTPEFVKAYDDSVALWVEMFGKFEEAIQLMVVDKATKRKIWSQFWSAHQRFFKYLCIAAKVNRTVEIAREAVKCGKCVVIGLQSTGEARTLELLDKEDGELNDFVCTAKAVLQSLVEKHFPAPDRNKIARLLGIKIPLGLLNGDTVSPKSKKKPVRQAAVRAAKKVKLELPISESDSNSASCCDSGSIFSPSESDNSSVVVISDDNDADVISNPSDNSDGRPLQNRLNALQKKKKRPAKKRKAMFDSESDITSDEEDDILHLPSQQGHSPTDKACAMREDLLRKIENLGERLPSNTLDELIDELGGPGNVAEMTGRKGRVVQTDNGDIHYESRSEVECTLETLNLTEKQRFMDGEKQVAIISEAASSGISLQSDRRARNQRKRVHITLELPWSADRAIQQFGRTHRSNQVNAPQYIFLISDLAGERRFASIVAKRLESLGALTHGDRRATETRDLSRFNIDNKYGHSALEAVMKAIMGQESPMVPPPPNYQGDFFKDITDALVGVGMIWRNELLPDIVTLDKDYNSISRFLNRILGVPVELQNQLFQYFTDTLQAIITQAKKAGRFDLGILDLGVAGENVRRVTVYTFLRRHVTGLATTELHIVQAERGMSWEEAVERTKELTGPREGFYLSYQIRNGKRTAILAVCANSKIMDKRNQFYVVYRPNTGVQLRHETLGEIENKYKMVKSAEAEKHWKQQYESSENTCSHAYWRGNCKNMTLGLNCEVGLRRRTYNVLSGSVLSVWTRVENILQTHAFQSKMQVVRLRTAEGNKIVGTLIPRSCVGLLREALAADAENTSEEMF